MSRKIIIAGACTLLLSAAVKTLSELALAERGFSAVGGEIIAAPIICYCLSAAVKTIKDIKRSVKNER